MKLPELELAQGTRFLGDLHLDPMGGEGTGRFLEWLADASAAGAPGVVILGDLFEYWIGPAQLEESAQVLEALRELATSGAAVLVVPGNRDFLLDRRFEERAGARVLPHGFVGLTAGGRVLVIHGDELCTLDRSYQVLRRTLRSAPVRTIAPRLPGAVSRCAARRLRKASARAVDRKPSAKMEQQPEACLALARAHACSTVVCGHAHRYREQTLAGGVRWLVVDAFGGAKDTLVIDGEGSVRSLAETPERA